MSKKSATKSTLRPTRRKPEKIPIGNSNINASDLRGLHTAWDRGSLVIFLGAGISIPYGLPSWRDLVLEMLFEQTEHTRKMGSLWPHYRRALAEWMTDYFDYNPLVLARMVERDAAQRAGTQGANGFLESLRLLLYEDMRIPAPTEYTALHAIGDLIKASTRNSGIQMAVTFNFDDLLEQELQGRGLQTVTIADGERQSRAGFPIVHPHGFVPRSGPIERRNLVFNETDYHRLTEAVFHWGLAELVTCLRKSTVLFIGLSMSDPSLRRLLDACRNSDIPPHWQIQKRHTVRDSEMNAVRTEVERRAQNHAQHMRKTGLTSEDPELEASIHAALQQADSYDREVFQSMGVKTIWINEWTDLPAMIRAVRPSAETSPRIPRPPSTSTATKRKPSV